MFASKMTQSKKEMTETSPIHKKQPTAAERKLYMQSLERQQKRFAETQNAFKQVRDVTKNDTTNFHQFI